MAASKTRIDWSLLLLRLAVGGMALFHGVELLRHAKGTISLSNAIQLASVLGELLCGALILAGVWMIPAVLGLLVIMGWPLVHGWLHGAPILGQPQALFRFLATLASGFGGAGKWAVGKD